MPVPVKVALHDETEQFAPAAIAELAGALNQQIGDLVHAWSLHAYAFAVVAQPDRPTPGTWAVHIVKKLDQPGALGYHSDQHRQPYAMVDGEQTWNEVTATVSHEVCEMCLDPFGNSLHAAAAPVGWDGRLTWPRVRYLREACDPVEGVSYETGGVHVSDFLLPAYYRSGKGSGSFQAGIAPRTILPDGYVSFLAGSDWWQGFNEGGHLSFEKLGPATGGFASLREFTDAAARARRG